MIALAVLVLVVVGIGSFAWGAREWRRLRRDRADLVYPWEREIRVRQLDRIVRDQEVRR